MTLLLLMYEANRLSTQPLQLEAVIRFTQSCSPQKPNENRCSLNKTRAIYPLYNLALNHLINYNKRT